MKTDHRFDPSESDEYYCRNCGLNRSLHADDGFQPGTTSTGISVNLDPNAQYHGGTPRETLTHEVNKNTKL